MPRKIIDYFYISLKGMGMGAADVVPGVSGGTIAFITGIYEELIESIKNINIEKIKLLLSFKFKEFWKEVNGNFLLSLFIGIAFSVLSFAKVIKYLLAEHPILVWSFFFGLIIASAIVVAKKIDKWNIANIISLFIGIAIAYTITVISPAETPEEYWFLFICGALAICAMILPGISGAFILLLLGKYEYILSSISNFNIPVIASVGTGAIVGLLSFSNVLSWLLKKHHNITIALLSGFMIGSLNKVWPWKRNITEFIDRHGNIKPLLQENISPNTFSALNNTESLLAWAVVLAIVGFSLIIIMDKFSPKEK